MAGGTWEAQNKVLPGVYINYRSSPGLLSVIGSRGVVAIPKQLDWGDTEGVIDITSIDEVYTKLGHDINSPEMLFIREIILGTTLSSGAYRILIYRLPTTGAAAATLTIDPLTVSAVCVGTRGNDISVAINPHPDTEYDEDMYAVFTVQTIVDGVVQASQTVGTFEDTANFTPAKIGDLTDNTWLKFSGDASELLTPSAGAQLEGGDDGTPAAIAYSSFLTAIEPYPFNVLIYDGADPVVRSSFALFVKRLSYDSGRYCQAVMTDCPNADTETVISVDSGYTFNDGTMISGAEATWWVGGATAGARNNQSLTYGVHPNAIGVTPRLNKKQMEEAIAKGSLVFFEEFGSVKVLTDINTFTSFTPDKGKAFRKNRVIRVLFSIANDIYMTYSMYYIGKVNSNSDGRLLFKAAVIGIINQLMGNQAVQNFTADDVEVLPGVDADSVVINLAVQPVDSVEKVYLTITIS